MIRAQELSTIDFVIFRAFLLNLQALDLFQRFDSTFIQAWPGRQTPLTRVLEEKEEVL